MIIPDEQRSFTITWVCIYQSILNAKGGFHVKLTDIKCRIDQLNGGTFQNLCDEYLTHKGYGIGYSLRMKIETSKTAKGNPDTYFLGKY
jgi:hypothetical protein